VGAPRFRGRRSFTRRGTRSPTAWAGLVVPTIALAIGTKIIVGSLAPQAGSSHETVTRIVGQIGTENAAGVGGNFAIGAYVASDTAIAAGVASLLDPITDIQDDVWTFVRAFPYTVGAARRTLEFDSRGMRKIEEGQQLVFVAANSVAGVTINFSVYIRALAKVAIRA